MPTDTGVARYPASRCSYVTELLRPVGASRWGMAAWLAAALGAILATTAVFGRSDLGSAIALGFVLTAVPSLPVRWREGLALLAIRASAVALGAALAAVTVGRPAAWGVAAVACAAGGAMLVRVGPTAGLAVVLVAADTPAVGGVSGGALLPYLSGAAVAALAWAGWFLCAVTVRIATGQADPHPAEPVRASWRRRLPHAARVAVTVAIAATLVGLLPDGMVGGHWLVTSVLLTVQPVAAETGMRLVQRLSGNTLGALIAAVVLGAHPSPPVVGAVAVALFMLAMALRPVNYTWWAVTGPPVLLMVSEYPQLFPWYEGGVRLMMNVAGAVIVVVVVFGLPALRRNGSRLHPRNFPATAKSDTVYESQTRRMR